MLCLKHLVIIDISISSSDKKQKLLNNKSMCMILISILKNTQLLLFHWLSNLLLGKTYFKITVFTVLSAFYQYE